MTPAFDNVFNRNATPEPSTAPVDREFLIRALAMHAALINGPRVAGVDLTDAAEDYALLIGRFVISAAVPRSERLRRHTLLQRPAPSPES